MSLRQKYSPGDLVQVKSTGNYVVVLECDEPTPHNPLYTILVLHENGNQSWVLDTQIAHAETPLKK